MVEKLSHLAETIQIEVVKDSKRKRRLQKRQLRRITTFFIWSNVAVGSVVTVLALIEHFFPSGGPKIITDRVLIAVIGGLTVQAGAIILAAIRGLFSK